MSNNSQITIKMTLYFDYLHKSDIETFLIPRNRILEKSNRKDIAISFGHLLYYCVTEAQADAKEVCFFC